MDEQIAGLRLPPHSIEAEQSVIGGMLLNNRAWEDVADIVSDDDFYRHDHRLIWQHIAQLMRQDRPADGFIAAITICSEVLAHHFPAGGHPGNALPDRIYQI